jgi:hypothetical protein
MEPTVSTTIQRRSPPQGRRRWRQVLEYFDAFIVDLTATSSEQTI